MDDNYIEGNYYEFFGYGERHIIRLIKQIEDFKYEIMDLTSNEKNVLFYEGKNLQQMDGNGKVLESKPFIKLQLTVCRISETKKDTKEDTKKDTKIFKSFLDEFVKDFKKLELNLDSELNYCLEVDDNSQIVKDDINDFFSKLDKVLKIKLTTEQKDNFIVEQFGQ